MCFFLRVLVILWTQWKRSSLPCRESLLASGVPEIALRGPSVTVHHGWFEGWSTSECSGSVGKVNGLSGGHKNCNGDLSCFCGDIPQCICTNPLLLETILTNFMGVVLGNTRVAFDCLEFSHMAIVVACTPRCVFV